MKYFILLGDGMADLPIPELSGMTPLQYAHKPNINALALQSTCGMVQTIPDGMEPGSGPANMSVMGYDPKVYYTGRSPLEALSLGIEMAATDMVFRCNLVSLSDSVSGSDAYENRRMLDYSAGEITTSESAELMAAMEAELSSEDLHFFPGKSYRHCMVWSHGPGQSTLTPPHDISDRVISEYLPVGQGADRLLQLMKDSCSVLVNHPVNVRRRENNLRTADSIWLWGQGTKPKMADFTKMYGKKGAVISAVDLVFGLGRGAGLTVVPVEGATGNLHTNFAGKAAAAIETFASGYEYIYLHVEAPDECGHQGDIKGKVTSIERIDQMIAGPVWQYLEKNRLQTGENYRILILPDHPTPIATRSHDSSPVPFLLFRSENSNDNHAGTVNYCESESKETGVFFDSGPALFTAFIT